MEKRLPIGIEDFEEIRTGNYYYMDKTGLIKELAEHFSKVVLFTRPRRFGKTMTVSMLKNFFGIGCKKEIFDGLEILGEQAYCEQYMGKHPVVSITLKDIKRMDYQNARDMLVELVNAKAQEYAYLLDSGRLSQQEKEMFRRLFSQDMRDAALCGSLHTLSRMLYKHHGKKAVVLIDEYDVPLNKAFENGYYSQMADLLQTFFSKALKTNEALEFAVLTGCLRISKESIFTGLNNFKVRSVTDRLFSNWFGFTDGEVRGLLSYYGLMEQYPVVKEWYDGYRFGGTNIYCPWDVIQCCEELGSGPDAEPQPYWINSSENAILKRLIANMDVASVKEEIDVLLSGEAVVKEIMQEVTYGELYASMGHLWSVLFLTGYLTQRKAVARNTYQLVIPNLEIKEIFIHQILGYFKENLSKNGELAEKFCRAIGNGQAEAAAGQLQLFLEKFISIRDNAIRNDLKENFYHGILLSLLSYRSDWKVCSNREAGSGYSDIIAQTQEGTGIVIEVKYRSDHKLEAGCREALQQIERNGYVGRLREDGMHMIFKYGIAFAQKSCRVEAAMENVKI